MRHPGASGQADLALTEGPARCWMPRPMGVLTAAGESTTAEKMDKPLIGLARRGSTG